MSAMRRYAWWAIFALSVVYALFGVGDVLGGIAFSARTADAVTGKTLAEIQAESASAFLLIDFVTRNGGITLAMMGLAFSAIAWFPYRRGERWSWWAMWALPAWALAVFLLNVTIGVAPGQTLSDAAVSAPVFAAIEAAALLVDLPRFVTPASDFAPGLAR